MPSIDRNRWSSELRQALLACLVAAAATWVAARVASLTFVQALLLVLVGALLARGARTTSRRRARGVAAVLAEPSSSASALALVALATDELRRGAAPATVVGLLKQSISLRPHPHTALSAPLLTVLEDADIPVDDRRQRGLVIGDVVRNEAALVRRQTIAQLSAVISSLGPNVYLVLYGYSQIVCEGIAQSATTLPVLVLEDYQYGEGASREHELTMVHLRTNGIRPYLVRFNVLGDIGDPKVGFVNDREGRQIALLRDREIVALIGCDAVDFAGHALVPAARDGRPSETAKFIEAFDAAQDGACSARLVVVTDCFKVCPDITSAQKKTIIPRQQNSLHRILTAAGLSPSPSYELVNLVATKQVSSVVTAVGVARSGSDQPLAAAHAYWLQRVADDTP